MKRWNYSKKLMTAVCLMFAGILSLCTINVLNFTNLNTTTIEEVADDTSNENDTSSDEKETSDDKTNEEENSQSEEENNATDEEINNDNANSETTENENNLNNNENDASTDTSEEDDLDDVVSAKVYYIDSASDLLDMDGSSDTFILRRNITLSGTWDPIVFYGNFDGQGYTISNIDVEFPYVEYAGFFAENFGSVSNVILEGYVNTSCLYMGGVAGYNAGSISNVWNKIHVTNNHETSWWSGATCETGGIAGLNNGSISNCMNSGNIRADSSMSYVGGIVGCSTSAKNCINRGSVNSGDISGGIIGYCHDYGSVSNCVNYASVNGGDTAGGIAGVFGAKTIDNTPEGNISNCATVGVICGRADTNITNCWYVGSSPCAVAYDSKITGGGKATNISVAVSNARCGFTIVDGSAYVRYFVKYVAVYVAIENENGVYESESDSYSSKHKVGFSNYLQHQSGPSYYMLASTNYQTVVSSIINNSNGVYEYVGIYSSLNGGVEDLIVADESSYQKLYNEAPFTVYVRFDLNPTEITAKVYYSTSFSSDGVFPSNSREGTNGGEATISAKSSNQTLDIDPKATIETEKGDTITFTMSQPLKRKKATQ